ncbi:hypothetical protein KGO95_02915 [Patescibacteria group bacterium]|nr:hypothetical protein [Patescibacteria group bacterium]
MDDFNLEHSIIESGIKNDLEVMEVPLSKNAFRLISVMVILFVGTVFLRVFDLSVVQGAFYSERSAMNVTEPVTLPATRGVIYGRYGTVLATNKPAFRVVFNAVTAEQEHLDLAKVASEAGPILQMSESDLQTTLGQANIEKTALVTLARNVDSQQIAAIEKLNEKALEVQDDYTRVYPMGPAFAQVIGYTGLAQYGEVHGRAGLEQYYDSELSGTDGTRLFYRSATGDLLGEKLLTAPQNGEDMHTTIDAGLQQYFYDRIVQDLHDLGRNIGLGIALDPNTGQVLAMVNVPSYDNNIFTDASPASTAARAALLSAPYEPLFNRAISGQYTPGSTIKPVDAIGGLTDGVITPQTEVFSKGYIELPNPYDPAHPSRFYDYEPNGWVNVRSALARSSNIFFYATGGGFGDVSGLGIDRLKQWWQFFGYGSKTGIDLAGESVGFLPDPQEKEAVKHDIWRIGDTYNVSIGQGDLLVTPIQLIRQIASIAANGKEYKPYLMQELVGSNGTTTVATPDLTLDYSNLAPAITEVQQGMQDVVRMPYGTAYELHDLPFPVAAKTGTSQTDNNQKVNALFVGYAPADHPQVVVLVLVENANQSSLNVVPVGKDVLNWYYQNRILTPGTALQ